MRLSWLEPRDEAPPTLAALAEVGVLHRHLEVDGTHEAALDELARDRGYVARDLVELSPTTPGLDELLCKFAREHLHRDDEVRYVLAGGGIFDIRDADDRWIRVEVSAGDLIVVPKDLYHRFYLDERRAIRCVRMFIDPAGWIAHEREPKV